MRDLFLKQLESNYLIFIYTLVIREKRYDLFFKTKGGQNGQSYRELRDFKNLYYQIRDRGTFEGLCVVLNPDGKICKNLHLVAIWLLTGVNLDWIQKKINSFPVFETDSKWLESTFSEKEKQVIIKEKEEWVKKLTK